MAQHDEWLLTKRTEQMIEEQAKRKAADDELMEMIRDAVKITKD